MQAYFDKKREPNQKRTSAARAKKAEIASKDDLCVPHTATCVPDTSLPVCPTHTIKRNKETLNKLICEAKTASQADDLQTDEFGFPIEQPSSVQVQEPTYEPLDQPAQAAHSGKKKPGRQPKGDGQPSANEIEKAPLKHPAMGIYRKHVHYCVPPTWRVPIAEAVGEQEASLALWDKTVMLCVGGWHNPCNPSGMLNVFKAGGWDAYYDKQNTQRRQQVRPAIPASASIEGKTAL
jgi:hypothetical protein